MVRDLTLEEVIEMIQSYDYPIDKRPFKLNIAGIRDAKDTTSLTFDDIIAYWYYDNNGTINGRAARGTTSPSKYWLENPMNPKGAAILITGHYPDTWGIGMHKGKYEALVQQKPVTVIRDNDRNSYLDFFADTTTGLYGINIHRSSRGKDDITFISQDSAGCQVFQNEDDFNEFMRLARISRDKYGNKFSYSLIDERDIIKKGVNLAVVGAVLIGLTAYIYFLRKKLGK
jgi:hypothetical protein